MLKIKNFHFIIVFITLILLGAVINNNLILIIYENIFIISYSVYVLSVIPQLNKIFQSFNKFDLNLLNISSTLILVTLIYRIYAGYEMHNLDGFEMFDYLENNVYYKINSFIIIIIIITNIPYLLTKSIISCEQKKIIKVSDNVKEFVISIFIPIFIYIMVPRINKIYENSLAENKDNELQINE